MNRTVLVEGILLLVFSFVCIFEGIHLVIYKDPHTLFDPIGPGFYVLTLSTFLMAVGFVHLIVNYKKNLDTEKVTISREMRKRMINMTAVLAIYILLINIIGYLLASIIFFLLEFRIVGIKSWPISIILTLLFTACFYVLFVHYCDMIFPHGIFHIPIFR